MFLQANWLISQNRTKLSKLIIESFYKTCVYIGPTKELLLLCLIYSLMCQQIVGARADATRSIATQGSRIYYGVLSIIYYVIFTLFALITLLN